MPFFKLRFIYMKLEEIKSNFSFIYVTRLFQDAHCSLLSDLLSIKYIFTFLCFPTFTSLQFVRQYQENTHPMIPPPPLPPPLPP